MRPLLYLVPVLIGLMPALLPAYPDPRPVYETGKPFLDVREVVNEGVRERHLTVRFSVRRTDGKMPEAGDRVLIQEDGRTVAEVELIVSREQALSAILCLDISGSMAANRKLQQAQSASLAFIDLLPPSTDAGLLLFDDQVRDNDPARVVPLAGDRTRYTATRRKMAELIQAARPEGGTAYLDATAKALQMLGRPSKLVRKAAIVMTDGADLASKNSLDNVIDQANAAQVPVYTIGIGEVGKQEVINLVLVLDRSGSMRAKASDTDAQTKLEALHDAASRFVDLTRPNSRTTLLPFSTTVDTPRPPTGNKAALKRQIHDITAEGGTRLYDAILTGIDTVVATAIPGKRAVVVLTDGKDEAPGSRASPVEIVRRAREEQVTLYTLGLGREREINKAVLEQLARDTGGQFFHASNQQGLMAIFEKLSLDLYDDGIDEESLKKLAGSTGGKYFHVKDAANLKNIFPELASDLQETYSTTFRSRREISDGTARKITLSVVRGTGDSSGKPLEQLSNTATTTDQVRGLIVVPEVDPLLYLGLLAGLAGLIALPALLKRGATST